MIKQKIIDNVIFDISDDGYVYRHDYIDAQGRHVKGKEIKPYLNTTGYLHFVFGKTVNGKRVCHIYFIHRLIAELFVDNPNPNEYNIVDHIDGNKLNNNPDNLRWVTQKMNCNNPNTKHKRDAANKEYWSKEENRNKASNIQKNRMKNDEIRKRYLHPRSVEAKERLKMHTKRWVHKGNERHFIYPNEINDYLNNGFVLGIGIKHSEETKQKLREANLGKTLSEEHKQKISNSLKRKNKEK